MKWCRAILFLLVLLWGAQTVYYYPRLPQRVVMNFKGSGEPGSWGSKDMQVFIMTVTVGIILCPIVILSCVLNRIPDKRMNIPNRDYWLAPERREETMRYLQTMLNGIGAITMGLIVAMSELINRANLRDPVQLSKSFPLLIGGFIVFMLIWVVLFAAKFYRVKNKAGL